MITSPPCPRLGGGERQRSVPPAPGSCRRRPAPPAFPRAGNGGARAWKERSEGKGNNPANAPGCGAAGVVPRQVMLSDRATCENPDGDSGSGRPLLRSVVSLSPSGFGGESSGFPLPRGLLSSARSSGRVCGPRRAAGVPAAVGAGFLRERVTRPGTGGDGARRRRGERPSAGGRAGLSPV